MSLLLYLDTKWPRQWDAETLFLDDDTDIGIVVRPKCFRAVLMDQVISSKPPAQHAQARMQWSLHCYGYLCERTHTVSFACFSHGCSKPAVSKYKHSHTSCCSCLISSLLQCRPDSNAIIAVLQDILHRVSTPSQVAGSRPRYSLVWKLVFMPRAEQQCCIAKASWGPPTALGSAARVESIKRSMLRKRKDSSA